MTVANDNNVNPSDHHGGHSHGNMSQLLTGFVLAIWLTVIPFAMVGSDTGFSKPILLAIVFGTGAIQIIVHLVYFLHLSPKSEGGWTMAATIFAIIILVIVLLGSWWVMYNMNANMMPSMQMGSSSMEAMTGAMSQ